MNHDRYIPASEVYQVSNSTLRWANQGKIPVVRFNVSGKRLYASNALETAIGGNADREKTKEKVAYARVISSHQKEDLERQIEDLRTHFPDHRIISDIGSGINFKRKGMQTILELAMSENLAEVVVMHRDRLARFGVELFESIFAKTGTKFVVFSKDSTDSPNELAEDLLAITTVFVARHNGARSAANRKTERARDEASARESAQDTGLSDSRPEEHVDGVVGDGSVDIQQVCKLGKDERMQSFQERVKGATPEQRCGDGFQSMGGRNSIRRKRRGDERCIKGGEIELRGKTGEIQPEISQPKGSGTVTSCPFQALGAQEGGLFGCVRE
jgi:predicted site-specific integrase-resolvase